MTIISNTVANVPVVIVDQVRLTDEAALQELCEAIASEVEGGEIENVVLDFELVETIGSPSLRMLLRAKYKLEQRGATLQLCGLQPTVEEVIRTTGISSCCRYTITSKRPCKRSEQAAIHRPLAPACRRCCDPCQKPICPERALEKRYTRFGTWRVCWSNRCQIAR